MGCNNTFVSFYWLISILTVLLGFPPWFSPISKLSCLSVCTLMGIQELWEWTGMCMASLIQCVRQKDQNQQFNSRDLCLSQLSKSSNHSGSLCIIGYCANTWHFFQIKTSRIQTKCCNVFPELPQWIHYQPCKVFFLFVDSKQEHCKVLLILFQMLRQWLHFSRLMD